MKTSMKIGLVLKLLICLFLSPTLLRAQEPYKVLVLPFEVFAGQDLSYLKKAIPEMLSTRLFTPGKIVAIEQERVERELSKLPKLDRNAIKELGRTLGADYVIWGSITQVGELISIDAQIMDLQDKKKEVRFFQEVRSLSEVIPQLTRFSRKARKYIEGKEEDFYQEDLALYPSPQAFLPGRMHPERGFLPYGAPFPRPISEESVVERAKPRFGDHGDPAYEGLTKDLVIDLSGPQPRVGFAKGERDNATQARAQQAQTLPPYYYYYPPQPNYNYSPPPHYFYQQQTEEGIFSRIKRALWPFGKKETPMRPMPHPIPVHPQAIQPQITPQQTPQPQPTQMPTHQKQDLIGPPNQGILSPSTPATQTQQPRSPNPWRWE